MKRHWIYLGDAWLVVSPGTTSLLDGAVDTTGLPGSQGNLTNGKGTVCWTRGAPGQRRPRLRQLGRRT